MKDHQKKRSNANLILNISWGIFSLLLLGILMYTNWQIYQLKSQQNLQQIAKQTSNQLDNLIRSLLESVYHHSIHDQDYKRCSTEELQQLVFNNPQVSALSIKDLKGHQVCSSMALAHHFFSPSDDSFVLLGPIKMSHQNRPAYLIQQRLGAYFLQIYLLEDVLSRSLHTISPLIQSIRLYDRQKNQAILYLEQDRNQSTWTLKNISSNTLDRSLSVEPAYQVRTPLTAVKNIDVFVNAFPDKIVQSGWYQELWMGLLFAIAAILIYFILRHWVNKHFSLYRALKIAMKKQQFYPVYQPIINYQTGSYCGAEILTRLKSNNHETIFPDFFIEDAEQSGLIIPITLQLIEKSFTGFKYFLTQKPDFYLSFNLSAIHFSHKHFLTEFKRLCEKYAIKPQQIMLEITERDLLSRDDKQLIKKMKTLRKAGFLLAVDDFGTGHASISYLQHFPFNYLKIDKIFIQAIGTGAITESLNQSIIQMAKNLQLNIIAEGVETPIQVQFLHEYGVNLMQGWHFAKAMNIDELLSFLKGVNHEE
mgnify:CR=1 FL=1